MAACKCHENYDDGNDWWKCPVHDKVTKKEYEDEYDVTPKTEKKPRPVTTKKERPAPKPKPDPKDSDPDPDPDPKDETNAPPDKVKDPDPEPGSPGEEKSGPKHGMSRRFWGD